MIELDVCVDRSGEVVVHHDTYLKETGELISVRLYVSVHVWRALAASGIFHPYTNNNPTNRPNPQKINQQRHRH